LKPALADYEAAVESVNAFRNKPSGSLRLSVLPPAAEFLIAPIMPQFLAHYPDLRIEISTEPALTDIVAERFDAGIRFGRRVERDMVAVRVSDDVHTIVVAAPEYLARRGTPNRPEDLREHNCIRLRFPSGAMLPWRFRRKGKRFEVGVEGSVIVNDPRMAVSLVADAVGVTLTIEPYVAPLLAQRRLVTILDGWAPRADAYYLYYPSRKQNPAALQALVDFLKGNLKASGGTAKRSHSTK
jgi:DNA-binding transcriptional LysR family regulator